MVDGKSVPTRSSVSLLALTLAFGLLAGCEGGDEPTGDGTSSTTPAAMDERVVVAAVPTSDRDAMCEAMTSEIETFVGEAADTSDEPPEDGQEICYSARGDGSLDYALGMIRVHEFSEDDVTAYREVRDRNPDEKQSECLIFTELTRDEDERTGAGVGDFSNAQTDDKVTYCGATADGTAVASFAVTGASVVLEIEVRGEFAGDPDDVANLRDSILDELKAVFG